MKSLYFKARSVCAFLYCSLKKGIDFTSRRLFIRSLPFVRVSTGNFPLEGSGLW